MKKILSIIASIALIFCMIPSMAFADEQVINISIDGTVYENINMDTVYYTNGKDINDCDIKIVSVNGHELENVGTKSGVLDSLGRTVLEFAPIKTGTGVWSVRINYHAVDDPVESNRAYGFEVTGITFKTDANATATKITAPAVKGLKATALKKSAKVSWTKSSKATGYKINCNGKTVTVKGKNSYTIKKLKSGKKYTIKVQSYRTYQDELGNMRTVKSSWKKTTVKVR